ncbi:uncharacterized protein LOC126845854 [Adelges cooleyi]|uniref:uncharacterized protein LOC126845854 n=1 Tax=Adelges cooleyi TaxID=133065 RepID=UPI00217F660C|nr:uncharacterized protein LOC126845854 [Adelges cooleyi]
MSPKLDSVVDVENTPAGVYRWTIPRPSFSSGISLIDSPTRTQENSIKSKASSTKKLLLCAQNLDAHNLSYNVKIDLDSLSIASSTHFTIVNGIDGQSKTKKPDQCWFAHHQLTVLVTVMTIVLFLAIMYCIFYVHRSATNFKINYV